MPVRLPSERYERRLDPTLTDVGEVGGMIRDESRREFNHNTVSKQVNGSKHHGPELIEPLNTQA